VTFVTRNVKTRRWGVKSAVAVARDGRDITAMRIASLLASATEIVCALGLEDALVAISHECDYPARILDRPRVSRPRFDPAGLSSGAIDAAVRATIARDGRVYVLDEPALRAAAPDLILAQAVCDVCAVPTSLAREAARALGGPVRVLSLDAHDVGGILDTIRQVGDAAGAADRARVAVLALQDRLDAVRGRVARAPRPRTLVLEWLDPVFVPGHWGPEMVALAGGKNLAGAVHERSRQLTWTHLQELDPAVLVIAPCGYGLDGALGEADRYRKQLMAVAPRAIRSGRAWAVDGSSYVNRSGPRVVDGVEILAAILHPEAFPDVDLTGRAAPWSA
jgi:iron complex transport system substrate-binding protein